MRTPRIRVASLAADRLRVGGPQAHHALHVLRVATGREVILFDGRGGEARGRIVGIDAEGMEIEVLTRTRHEPQESRQLVLAVAIPKGERADWMVEKCAELGVSRLLPLISERGVVHPGEAKLERWRRKATEAARQCGRSAEMQIDPPRDLPGVLALIATQARIWYGDAGRARATLFDALRARPEADQPRADAIIIGPEGGLTEQECRSIEGAGGHAVSLSDAVLRVETAAIAAAAIWGADRQAGQAPGPVSPFPPGQEC